MNTNVDIPVDVKFILKKLNTKKSTAYIVGGCVRDSLLSLTPRDWDICTSLKPDEVKKKFKGYKIIDTGIQHGTVTVIVNGNPYEITTYRIDGNYDDSRHPSDVTFTDDIEQDLSRRDFTMNAIAYNETVGFVDPFNGIDDIRNLIIRCVGDPNDRFQEDALRILRAERFAMTLSGFSIEENTEQAMMCNRFLLKNISIERINMEFWKAIGNETYIDIRFMKLLQAVLPEYLSNAVIEEIAYTLSQVETLGYITIAFMYQIMHEHNCKAFEKDYQSFMKKLRCSNKEIKDVSSIFKCFSLCLNNDFNRKNPKIIDKYILNQCDKNIAEDVIYLLEVYSEHIRLQSNRYATLANEMSNMLELAADECHTVSELQVDGNDLLAIGLTGESVGETLRWLLNEVINERLVNDHEVLINKAINKTK